MTRVKCNACRVIMRIHCGSPTCSWNVCSSCQTVFCTRTARVFYPLDWTYR